MTDDKNKGLPGLLGVRVETSDQEAIERKKARIEVGKKLGVVIPDPNEKRAAESYSDLYMTPSINIELKDKPRVIKKTGVAKNFSVDTTALKEVEKQLVKDTSKSKGAWSRWVKANEQEEKRVGYQKEADQINALKKMDHFMVENSSVKHPDYPKAPPKKVTAKDVESIYKYPVKKFDPLDSSTYPSDPKQRTALAHGTATDQINRHHKDRQGKLLPKENARKTMQYISDQNKMYGNGHKAKWLFNPVTGELEDTNDPQFVEKSEKKMAQFEDHKVDPQTGMAEPKLGTDAHKEKYPERYKSGYVSKSDRIVSQLKDLKEFGRNKLKK